MHPGDSRNLILTGFMGTGKTTVGRELARRLGREFVDMDALLVAREGVDIPGLFHQRGECYFREIESALCHEVAARSGLVVATGGGALCAEANREILGASGSLICLTATPDKLLRRLDQASDRPLLEVADRRARLTELLAERAMAYGRIPLQVDTTALTIEQVADRVLALSAAPMAATIPVLHPGGDYTIHLGWGMLARSGALLGERCSPAQVALITNGTVGALYAEETIRSLEAAGFQVAVCMIPDGEVHKTLYTVETLYDFLIESGVDRQGAVLALGGGVVGDIAGFAAATYLRGVPLVQVPTSLLAMVDSSVGGKVAVDHLRGKNLIGAFKQPDLVLADLQLLSTLPPRELAAGLAETVKAGLVGDPRLLRQIEQYGPAPRSWLVERAIRVKVAVVQEDPYEKGRRAVLNLGHTFGHALEVLSDYALGHGDAVSIGLVAAARLSARLALCDPALPARLEAVLARLDLPIRYRGPTPKQVWAAMGTDKKRSGKALRFVLLRAVGDVFVADQVRQEDVLSVLEALQGN